MKHGFKPTGSGLYTKGAGKARVEAKPSSLMRSKSGDLDFNPRTDATAVRMGAVFVSDNRYRLDGFYPSGRPVFVDRNGSLLEDGACPGCASVAGEARMFVRVESRNPFAKPWQHAYTYCRQCSPKEIAT